MLIGDCAQARAATHYNLPRLKSFGQADYYLALKISKYDEFESICLKLNLNKRLRFSQIRHIFSWREICGAVIWSIIRAGESHECFVRAYFADQ
jgi:hypothetical protein